MTQVLFNQIYNKFNHVSNSFFLINASLLNELLKSCSNNQRFYLTKFYCMINCLINKFQILPTLSYIIMIQIDVLCVVIIILTIKVVLHNMILIIPSNTFFHKHYYYVRNVLQLKLKLNYFSGNSNYYFHRNDGIQKQKFE